MNHSVGVLLTNLGSPDAPTPAALRRYLAEFLSDRRVVDLPRPLWWLILHGAMLRTRPRKSAALYRSVWSEEGAPLLAITQRQAEQLRARLQQRFGSDVPVVVAMRYGNPSISAGLESLRQSGADKVLVLPLYPQYSATTTASTFDAVADALRNERRLPALRFIDGYYDDDDYVNALTESVRLHRKQHGAAEKLLFSFHGIPQRYADGGDPYPQHCSATVDKVVRRLGLGEEEWQLTYQSRFGSEPWLQPYTDKTLQQLARDGVKRVQVICPGFAADCLETLEEIDRENRTLFLAAGGEEFSYIPALNDSEAHIHALAAIVQRNLAGWLGGNSDDDE